jgi:hypothetical protein
MRGFFLLGENTLKDITLDEINRLALIRQELRLKAEAENEPKSEQGIILDSVDAFQHGILSGAADLADGARYATGSETIGKGANFLRKQAGNQIDQMSSSGREAFQNFGIESNDDSITGYGFKEGSNAKGFGLNFISGLGSFAPTMAPGLGAAKVISAAGKATGIAGKSAKAATALDKGADVVGFAGVGAASIGGSTGNQAYETVSNASLMDLANAPVYREKYRSLREGGLDHESAVYQAREDLARELATEAAKDGAIMGAITQGALGPVMGKLFRGEAGGIGKAAATGAITEGSQELVESGGQTAISNMAVNPAVPTNTMDNVIGDALTGAMVGGPVGGAFGGAGSVRNRFSQPKDDVTSTDTQPVDNSTASPVDQIQAQIDQIETQMQSGLDTMTDAEYEQAAQTRANLLNELDRLVGNTDDSLSLIEKDQNYQVIEDQITDLENRMIENGDNLSPPEFAELEAKRNELLQRRAEITGEQPMDFSGPVESQAQTEQLFESSGMTEEGGIYEGDVLRDSLQPEIPLENREISSDYADYQPVEQISNPVNQQNSLTPSEPKAQVIAQPTNDVVSPVTQEAPIPPSALQEPITLPTKTPVEAPVLPTNVEVKPLVNESVAPEDLLTETQSQPMEPVEPQKSPEALTPEVPATDSKPLSDSLNSLAADTNTQPTEKQIEADNYKKGRLSLHGLDIAIENPKDSVRSGQDSDGKKWESKMAHHYGDIKGIKGADGDDLDVFIGDKPESDKAYIVDQVDPKTGEFDEHKVMLGFDDKAQAESGYLANYEDGWKGVGAVTEMPISDFKEWIKSGNTTKPVSELMGGKADKAIESEPAELPPVKLSLSNKPFKTESSARLSRTFKDTPNAEIVPVDGGFGIREVMKGGKPKGVTSEVKPNTQPVTKDPIKGMEESPTEQSVKVQDSTPTDTKALLKLSSTVKDDNKADIKGMEIDQVQKVVDGFLKEYNGNIPLKFRIEKTQEELYGPEATVKNIGRIYGAYHPKEQQFVLAAANLQDDGAIRKTLRHEIIGHYGLNVLEPKDKALLLEKITASRSVPSLKSAWENVDKNYTDAPKNVQAEEVFAFIAENEPKGLEGLYDQILSTLNKGLRKVGLSKQSISRSELRVLAKRIGNQIKAGEGQKVFPKNDSSSFSKDAAKPTPKSLKAALKPLIDQLHEQNTFEVVQSVNDLPFAVRLLVKKQLSKSKGENATVRGVNAGAKNYLIADGIRDEKEAVSIFLHEVVGHKAVLDMLGKEGDTIMERIAYSYGPKQLQDLIKAYGADFKTKEGRILLGKEKVAQMAEKNEKPSLLGKLVANVKAWLRNYFPNIKWSDNDILNMLATARDKVENRYMVKVDLDQAESKNDTAKSTEKVNLSIKVKVPTLNDKLRETDKTFSDRMKKTLSRWVMPGGLMPDSIKDLVNQRDRDVRVHEFDLSMAIGKLNTAIKKKGISVSSMTDEQWQDYHDYLTGQSDGAALSEGEKDALNIMREHVDGLTQEYVDITTQKTMDRLSESEKLSVADANEMARLEKMMGNMGKYLNRSYKAFDDPKWFSKIPDRVINKARFYLADQYQTQGMTAREAARKAEVTLHEITKTGTAYDNLGSFISESKLGSKDLSTLIKRKNISPEILALLGEYKDPRINYAKSVSKMSSMIANDKLLQGIKDRAMGVFIFEKDSRPPEATVQLSGEKSDVYAPLNGIWTTPDIKLAFEDAMGLQAESGWLDAAIRVNAMIKYGKTVLSPTTAMRNIMSSFFFNIANGHFNQASNIKNGLASWNAQVKGKTPEHQMEYTRKLIKLGVIFDGGNSGEMVRMMTDGRIQQMLEGKGGKAFETLRAFNEKAVGFYRFGDDFWKIIGYENEKAMLVKAGFSLADAEKEAAERIQDTYPTYSRVPKAAVWLSRFPVSGTFVSFPAEIIRTTANMFKLTAKDYKSDNPVLRKAAAKRMVGMSMAGGAIFAMSALSKAMLGVTDDEEEALRDLAPEWQKNSTFVYTGRDKDGNLRYFDMTFLDPYGYFKRPFEALMRDQPWEDALASGIKDMLTPFFGLDITMGSIIEVVSNQKVSGGAVYKENDTATRKAIDISGHLAKSLAPGVVNNFWRTALAFAEVKRSTGQPYDLGDEALAWLGFRSSTFDPAVGLYYRTFDFNQAVSEAKQELSLELRNPNKRSDSQVKSAWERAGRKQDKAFREMSRLVSAAQKSGVSSREVAGILKLSGISSRNISYLLKGKVPPVNLSDRSFTNAYKKANLIMDKQAAQQVRDRFRQIQQTKPQ